MRILKAKISRALSQHAKGVPEHKSVITEEANQNQGPKDQKPYQLRLRTRITPNLRLIPSSPKGSTSGQNIMKNYSRAMATFALSQMTVPYTSSLFLKHEVDRETFKNFVISRKYAANCIKGLRELFLLIKDVDSEKIVNCKKVFQELCVVFLKYFSVNWIFNSKIADKKVHLSYRLKILRRVRNPSSFTYLEDFMK